MKRSTSRILTTHTGSLPRPPALLDLLMTKQDQRELDENAFAAEVGGAVADVVAQQVDIGIDVINDGEQGRSQYATYVTERLTGFEGEKRDVHSGPRLDYSDFPEYFTQNTPIFKTIPQPACNGPIGWKDWPAVQKDIDRLKAVVDESKVEDAFMTSASPGVIAIFLPNAYYPTKEAYLYALADVMKEEYKAIVDAGFLLQLDCPDLAMSRVVQFSHLTVDEFRKIVEQHVEVINYALQKIPPQRVRLHLCWGNSEGPHNHDVPLKSIIDLVLKAKPAGLCFEGANPRHAHEWNVWQDVKLPEGKVIIPGVLDTTTNFIEHPELVAERTVRYAEQVGRENVMVGSDCGFGTSIWGKRIDTRIVWAKLQAMVEGARLASDQLW